MSLKKVQQVKGDRGFKLRDLIIYGLVVVIVAGLFIAVFATRDTSPLKGVRIYVESAVVFEYDFEKGEYEILDAQKVTVASETEEELSLRLTAGGGFNEVLISKSGSVKMTDADCNRKDCVYMPEITDNSGFIYCSPHRVKIVPYGFDEDSGVIKI